MARNIRLYAMPTEMKDGVNMDNGISEEQLDSFLKYVNTFRTLTQDRTADASGCIRAPKLEILFLLEIAEGLALAAKDSPNLLFAEKVIEADAKTGGATSKSKTTSH